MLKKYSSSTLCDVCRSTPSTIFCRADLAHLCATCDAVVHSANPLAGSHHRVTVVPTSGFKYEHQDSDDMSMIGSVFESQGGISFQDSKDAMDNEDEEDEAGSWVLFGKENENGETNGFLFNGDDYLDLVEYNSSQDSRFSDDHRCHDLQFDIRQTSYGGGGGMVPVKCEEGLKHHQVHRNLELAMEYESSNGGYGFPSVQIPVMVDRKARVLRYMEKKKRRTFEKTIRYASRKAYAETRPRIKGRFAKRTNVGVETEEMFSTTLRTEGGYCINVPCNYM